MCVFYCEKDLSGLKILRQNSIDTIPERNNCQKPFSFRRKHFFKGFEIQNFFCCSVLRDISLEALLFILENRTDFSQNLLEFHFPKMVATLYAWSRSLCKGWTSFCTGLISRKLCRFLLMF